MCIQISLPELLMAYYPRCGRAEVDQFIAKYDPQDRLDHPDQPLTEEQEEELESIIALVDKNADELIDHDELTFFCSNLGLEDDTVDRWLAEYGAVQCSTLTKREFRQLFTDVFYANAAGGRGVVAFQEKARRANEAALLGV
eukprot:TRINITY_DN2860_c0_g1_i1.p1 TRINITY_DN2860_c0_g1~~TRINITY_DN2860_c0_g1_i1.p1  ORF type:complete len:142 (-),score=24.43 TRINITY_DN2860_c0_g1_i1:391-816(-)